MLPPLDAGQVQALGDVGRQRGAASDGSAAALPVDPSLNGQPELRQSTRWARLVHIEPAGGSADELEAADEESAGLDAQALGRRIRRAAIGPPLRSTALVQEPMRKLVALPVLPADALSSVAYGTMNHVTRVKNVA